MTEVCKEIRGIVYTDGQVQGKVISDGSISGKVNTDGFIQGIVNYRQCLDYATYSGDYIVTPRSYEQTLDTSFKVLEDDVTVKQIPYFETSNEDGTTVYIGTL